MLMVLKVDSVGTWVARVGMLLMVLLLGVAEVASWRGVHPEVVVVWIWVHAGHSTRLAGGGGMKHVESG